MLCVYIDIKEMMSKKEGFRKLLISFYFSHNPLSKSLIELQFNLFKILKTIKPKLKHSEVFYVFFYCRFRCNPGKVRCV